MAVVSGTSSIEINGMTALGSRVEATLVVVLVSAAGGVLVAVLVAAPASWGAGAATGAGTAGTGDAAMRVDDELSPGFAAVWAEAMSPEAISTTRLMKKRFSFIFVSC